MFVVLYNVKISYSFIVLLKDSVALTAEECSCRQGLIAQFGVSRIGR